jgi:hypothetical protein
VEVAFQPQTDTTFATTLQVNSNASNGNVRTSSITGKREMVTAWTLRINQIEVGTVCPAATAYVSVIDQGGFPVIGLALANFKVTQGIPFDPTSVEFVGSGFPVAIAAVLDHSESLTRQPVAFADMKLGFTTMFGSLRAGDEGAVINFDSAVELVQPWTTNKASLQAVIATPWDRGPDTRLYDAANLSVSESAKKSGVRRAAVIATDGEDLGPTSPFSTASLDTVIANAVAAKVPLFTVGVGTSIKEDVLRKMATDTGGLFYKAATSQNLATIYDQLSSILYKDQYVVKFNRIPNQPGSVTIGATNSLSLSATDTRPITPCP